MQEFLTNNTVSWNLMSLTGYRTLVILEALLESPKSNAEINEYLYNNQYIKEKFSSDTLRLYINSLRAIGCEITSANKSGDKRYVLTSHPFAYDIPNSQLKILAKFYKNIYDKLDFEEVLQIENFFRKLIKYVKNESTVEFLTGISLLKNVDRVILDDLLRYCKNKTQVSLLYKSPRAGERKIEIIADKLLFKSEKLYLCGNDVKRKTYSFFSVERISKILNVTLLKEDVQILPTTVVFELYNKDYFLEPDEKIIDTDKNKLTISVEVKNEFMYLQRLLYFGSDCKVLEPDYFRAKLINKLKAMEVIYEKI